MAHHQWLPRPDEGDAKYREQVPERQPGWVWYERGLFVPHECQTLLQVPWRSEGMKSLNVTLKGKPLRTIDNLDMNRIPLGEHYLIYSEPGYKAFIARWYRKGLG